MFVKLQSQLRFASSSNFDACNYDEGGKQLVVLSVNLTPKACYTAVNSRRGPPSPGPKGHYLLPVITRRERLDIHTSQRSARRCAGADMESSAHLGASDFSALFR